MGLKNFISKIFSTNETAIPEVVEEKFEKPSPVIEEIRKQPVIEHELKSNHDPIETPKKEKEKFVGIVGNDSVKAELKKSLRELSARVPKRPNKVFNPSPKQTESFLVQPKVYDVTENPNKYWRRFKRNKKYYYKKFYHQQAA